jgi:hypothetical protein
MTNVVIGDILPRTQAIATAGQTIFGTNWTANTASDVVVYYTPVGSAPDDATQMLNFPADYSVAFIGGSAQVQVTLTTPVANNGDIITITRQTPADFLNLYSNTNFTPSMLNNDFGILTLVDQQAQLVNQLVGPRYNYSAVIQDVIDTILPILGPNELWVKNGTNTEIVAIDFTQVIGGGTVSPGLINQLTWYAASGDTISGLSTANNAILGTNNSGVPAWTQTIPLAVQSNITQLGTQTQALNMGNNFIHNVTSPVAATDAVNKAYADSIAGGLNPLLACQAASTTALTVTYNNGSAGIGATLTNAGAQAAFVIDGYTASLNDRILIKNQASTLQNGVYTVTNLGSNSTNWVLTRATNYDTPAQIQPGDLLAVENGGQAGSSWIETATVTTIGTDAILFSAFFTPATYLQVANNLSDVANHTTARNNLLTAAAAGKLLRASGTDWVPTTATFADTYTASNLLYSNGANTVVGLATANNGVLITSAGGVPSISNTLPSGLTIPSPIIKYSDAQFIEDNNGNPLFAFGVAAGAVNFITAQNQSTGNGVQFFAAGTDTNISFQVNSKGTSGVEIKGRTSAVSPPIGYVGEFFSSVIASGSAVSVTLTGTPQDLTHITLPAGDFDVWANISFITGTQNLADVFCWISSSSAALPDASLYSTVTRNGANNFGNTSIVAPSQRFLSSGSTTVYISGQCDFGSGSVTMCGGIYARRRS